MKRAARLAASGALLVVLAVPESYRTVGQTQEEKPVTLNTELVVVDALVMNKQTRAPVFDLRKEDFTVYDNGKKQEITQFSRDQLPLSVVLVVENSYRAGLHKEMGWVVFDSGKQVLRSLKDKDEVALVFATNTKKSASEVMREYMKDTYTEDFTAVKGVIEDKLKDIFMLRSYQAMPDAIRSGIYTAALFARRPMTTLRRRVIIAITKDGKNYQMNSWGSSEEETRRELLSCGAVVYGMLLDDHDMEDKILNRHLIVIAINKFTLTADIRNYAKISGGSTVEVEGPEDVGQAVRRIFDDLKASYTLAYYPSNRKLDGKFHKIEVKISRGVEQRENGVIVRARSGYYAATSESNDAKKDSRP